MKREDYETIIVAVVFVIAMILSVFFYNPSTNF